MAKHKNAYMSYNNDSDEMLRMMSPEDESALNLASGIFLLISCNAQLLEKISSVQQ